MPIEKAVAHVLAVAVIVPLLFYLWRRWVPAASRFGSGIPLDCPACGRPLPKLMSRRQWRAIRRDGWTCEPVPDLDADRSAILKELGL